MGTRRASSRFNSPNLCAKRRDNFNRRSWPRSEKHWIAGWRFKIWPKTATRKKPRRDNRRSTNPETIPSADGESAPRFFVFRNPSRERAAYPLVRRQISSIHIISILRLKARQNPKNNQSK